MDRRNKKNGVSCNYNNNYDKRILIINYIKLVYFIICGI